MGKIIKKRIEYGGSSNSAENIKYDDTKNVKEAINEVGNLLGNTDISAIGDGTVTGGLDALNSKLVEQKMLGWTVPSECPIQNYVDSDGVFHQIVGRVDLGSLDFEYSASDGWFQVIFETKYKDTAYCNKYITNDYNQKKDKTISNPGMYIVVIDSSYTDETVFKSAMQGVYLYYGLTEEILIKVDGNEAVTKLNSNLYNAKNPVMLYDISTKSYNANDFLGGNIDMSAYSGFLIYYSDRVGGYQKSSYFTGNMRGMYQALDFTNDNDEHYFAGVQVRSNGLFVEIVGANKPFIVSLYGIPA